MTSPFRLETVHRVRHREERAAAAAYARSLTAGRDADAAVRSAEQALRSAAPPPTTTGPGLTLALIRGLALAVEANDLRARSVAAHDVSRAQQSAWQGCAQRAAGLSRLKDRHTRATRLAEARAEERELDDYSTGRYAARRPDPTSILGEPIL